jgi:hypothetical protein
MSTPLRPATSISAPRVISAPTFSIPSLLNPIRVEISSSYRPRERRYQASRFDTRDGRVLLLRRSRCGLGLQCSPY